MRKSNMRLKVILSPVRNECNLPFNYQHSLSSAIYQLIQHADGNYASHLHNKGLKSADGKPLKLFTFSYLFTPRKEIIQNHIFIRGHQLCYFYLSSPLTDNFVKNVVIGLFGKRDMTIHNEKFHIVKVQPIISPKFTNETRFKCLSPFVLSTMREHNGGLKPHYYRPDENGLSEAVKNNLMRKFRTLHQKEPDVTQFDFSLDQNYIQRHDPKRLTKLITLKEGQGKQETKISSIFVPFKMSGSIELMQTAWEAGLGTHCSQGFGCIDIIN